MIAWLRKVLFGVCALTLALTLTLAVSSLWVPRMMGTERLWSLETGAFVDTLYIGGIRLRALEVPSGLENLFAGRKDYPPRQSFVVIYSKSLFQPARGGRWMRVAQLALKIVESHDQAATIDRARLLQLIDAQNDVDLGRWYYEMVKGAKGSN